MDQLNSRLPGTCITPGRLDVIALIRWLIYVAPDSPGSERSMTTD